MEVNPIKLSDIIIDNNKGILSLMGKAIDKDFENLLSSVYSLYETESYKEAMRKVRTNAFKFQVHPLKYKLYIIKIKIGARIIQHKINKYKINKENMHITKVQVKKIKKYAHLLLKDLELCLAPLLKKNISEINSNVDELNSIRELCDGILEFFYVITIFHKRLDNIIDAFSYLAMAQKYIPIFLPIICNPDSLSIIQDLYLLLSGFYLANYEIDKTLFYLEKSLHVSTKEFLYRLDYLSGVDEESMSSFELAKKIDKILEHISIAFFYRGMVFEREGLIIKAIEGYKQSKFFTSKMILPELTPLHLLFNPLRETAINYNDTYEYLAIKKEELEKKKIVKEKKRINNKCSIKLRQDVYGEREETQEIEQLRKVLSNINMREIDLKSKYVKTQNKGKKFIMAEKGKNPMTLTEYSLNNLDLINKMLDDKEFKHYILNTKHIKISSMDKDNQEKIQKIVDRINFKKSGQKEQKESVNKFTSMMSKKHLPIAAIASNSNITIDTNIENKKITKKQLKKEFLDVKKMKTLSLSPMKKTKTFSSNSLLRANTMNITSYQQFKVNKDSMSNPSTTLFSQNVGDGINFTERSNKTIKSNKTNNTIVSFSLNQNSSLQNNNINSFMNNNNDSYSIKGTNQNKNSASILPSSSQIKLNTKPINLKEQNFRKKINKTQTNFTLDVFNKKILDKRSYLEKLGDQEIKFQKKLLKMKHFEEILVPEGNKNDLKNKAEIKLFQMKGDTNEEQPKMLRNKITLEYLKQRRKENFLKNSLVSSLDSKILKQYEENQELIKKKEMDKLADVQRLIKKKVKISSNNNEEIIEKINNNLYDIDEKISHTRNKIFKIHTENNQKRNKSEPIKIKIKYN